MTRPHSSVLAAVVVSLLHGVSAVRAQPTPTVTGPDDGQVTLGIPLPGPGTRPVLAAIGVDFQGTCLQKSELAHGVDRWLDHARVNHRVTVELKGEEQPVLGARFWLLVDGQRASLRRFERFSGTCEELTSSLSAAIGLAIEAVDLSEFPQPEPPKPKPILAVAQLTARAPLEEDAPPPRALNLERRAGLIQLAALGGQLLGGVGVSPGSTAGFGLRGELGFRGGSSTRLGASYLMVASAPIADGTMTVRTLALQAGACWGGRAPEYGAQVCLDAWLGGMTARPESLERESVETLPWFALAPAAEIKYQASERLDIRFGAQLSFNLVRPRFEVLYSTRDEPLDQRAVPPLGLIGSLGLDWSLL